MQSAQRQINRGIKLLSQELPAFELVIQKSPKFDLMPQSPTASEALNSLVMSVIGQQISTSAAATIGARVNAEIRGEFTPLKVLRVSTERFRELGVSGAKTRTIHELAAAVKDKELHLQSLAEMTDSEIITELSAIWGIGKWTAQMFLMFDLGRLDVWPVGDFGVRKGWQILHADAEMLSEKQFADLADNVAPFRSIPAWYCWRAIDLQKLGEI